MSIESLTTTLKTAQALMEEELSRDKTFKEEVKNFLYYSQRQKVKMYRPLFAALKHCYPNNTNAQLTKIKSEIVSSFR